MKVRAPVKKLYRSYRVVKRDDIVRVIYSAEPKHKQRQGWFIRIFSLQSWIGLARLASQSFVCLHVSI